MYKRVFIVKEGQWGMVGRESYLEQIEMYQKILEEAKDSRGNKMAKVIIVETADEAIRRVKMEADIVVFISRAMEIEAELVAKGNPKVKVVVFTGDIPNGKVIWANKGWVDSRKGICDIVLNW